MFVFSLLLYFLITLLLVCATKHYLTYKTQDSSFTNIHELKGLPIFGIGLKFLLSLSFDETLIKFLKELLLMQKSCRFKVFNQLTIFANSPDDIKTVLSSNYCLDRLTIYRPVVGDADGLIVLEAKRWKIHRKLLNSSFNIQIIKSYINDMNEVSQKLVNDLKGKSNHLEEEINIFDIIGLRVTELQLNTIIGERKLNMEKIKKIYHVLENIMKLWRYKMGSLGSSIFLDYIDRLFGKTSRTNILYNLLLDELKPIIDSTKALCLQGSTSNGEIKIESIPPSECFAKQLIELNNTHIITDSELNGHLINTLMAGTDTSTTALSNILLCLAIHQDIQETVYSEINDVLKENSIGSQTDDFIIDNDLLQKFSFLDRVIKECLRLLPVVSLIGRKSTSEIHLENGIVPTGTEFFIPINNIHKCKHVWGKNADQFNPDNFLTENVLQRPSCSYLPFGYGQRNCIGNKFAQMFMKIFIIKLIKTYKFSTSLRLEDLHFYFRISAMLLNGHFVKIEKR